METFALLIIDLALLLFVRFRGENRRVAAAAPVVALMDDIAGTR